MAKEEKKEKIVRLTDKVAVKATETNPAVKRGRMKTGQIYEIHPSHLEYLVSNKFVISIEEKE
jgi:hypothetical protein